MAGSSVVLSANPYVGPRPFETGEHLFGREREIAELYYLLSAERIVLLHSPSGAGKSSMIQAGLLPRLRERFDVWRPTRVNLPLPDGAAGGTNRYVLSAALGLEQGIPAELRRPPEELAGMTLIECVRTRKRRPSAPASVLLIFDQFEEILTIDPLAVKAKQEFFEQLGELLRDPTNWALFAMREDYLAPLDPYAEQVPTHLQNRFRIDLLGLDDAREAIAGPSEEAGRVFEGAAVEKLVGDLATMKVQQPDGSFVNQTGLHVEPLQLQVVCRGLWERLAAERRTIGVEDVTQFGNVTEALSKYYAVEVARIANQDDAIERAMREWIGDRLITLDGTRGQVLRGAGKSEGLANALIASLVDTHLLRAEQRAGAVWYELAHDRLIEPIRDDNARWRDAHLNQVQKRVSVWIAEGRPAGLLLLGEELAEARRWAEERGGLTEDERKFLDACEVAEAAAHRQRRQQRLILWLAVASMIATVVSGYEWWNAKKQSEQVKGLSAGLEVTVATLSSSEKMQAIALEGEESASEGQNKALEEAKSAREIADQQRNHAEQESQIALSSQLLAQAGETLSKRPDLLQLSTLLALESMKRDPSVEADEFLRQSLAWMRTPLGQPISHGATVRAAVFSPDGASIATASDDGTVKVSDALTGALRYSVTPEREVQTIAFSLDGRYLATASTARGAFATMTTGAVSIRDAHTGKAVGEPIPLKWTGGRVSVCFSPSGRYVAANADDTVAVWEAEGKHAAVFHSTVDDSTSKGAASFPLFTPDGKYLIAYRNKTMNFWEVDGWKAARSIKLEQATSPKAAGPDLAMSPDGKLVATNQSMYRVPGGEVVLAQMPGGYPYFSPDGSYVASASSGALNVKFQRYKTDEPSTELTFDEGLTSVAFSPQNGYLATASNDGTARLWHLSLDRGQVKIREAVRLAHPAEVNLIAFSRDGRLLASADKANTVRVWRMEEDQEGINSHWTGLETGGYRPAVLSADGRFLAFGDDERIQVLRAADKRLMPELRLPAPHEGKKIGYFDMSSDGRFVAAAVQRRQSTETDQKGRQRVDFVEDARQIWDRSSGRMLPEFSSEGHARVFAFSPDGRYLAIGNDDEDDLDVRETHTGKRIFIPPIAVDKSNFSSNFFFTPTGRYLAIAGRDREVHLLDTATWTDRHTSPLGTIIRMAPSANGEYLAAAIEGETESKVEVLRTGDLKIRAEIIQKKMDKVTHNTYMTLSPDGEYVATGDWARSKFFEERRVLIWKVASSQIVGKLPLKDEANYLSFSADGRYLGIGTTGGLKIWDQRQSGEIASADTTNGNVLVVFSPDAKYLLAIDDSQGVSAWFWASSRVTAAVCSKLTMNLSREEWDQYLPGQAYRPTCPELPVPASGSSRALGSAMGGASGTVRHSKTLRDKR